MVLEYLQEVTHCLSTVSTEKLSRALELIDQTAKKNRLIFVIGNGGSAAIASHFVVDLIKSGSKRNSTIRAISLVDNSSLLTATSNDFSFSEVFSWQLEQYASSGDLLIAISSSGNSQNILQAIDTARKFGMCTIAICGFDGGKSLKSADVAIFTQSKIGNYGPVEDSHSIICHYLAREIRKY